jgi:hypothetical protein
MARLYLRGPLRGQRQHFFPIAVPEQAQLFQRGAGTTQAEARFLFLLQQ